MFILYPVMKIIEFCLTLLAWIIINPVAAALVQSDGYLPKYLYWFQTFDAQVPQGYWNALTWLNRNPIYGFDLMVFGLPWNPDKWITLNYSDNKLYTIFIAFDKRYGAFNLYYHNKTYDKYLKLGWKAWNFIKIIDGIVTYDGNFPGTNGRVPFC